MKPGEGVIPFSGFLTLPQWILWKIEEKGGRYTKVPYQSDGEMAQANNKKYAAWIGNLLIWKVLHLHG